MSVPAARRAFSRRLMHWAFIDQLKKYQLILLENLRAWDARVARALTLFGQWYTAIRHLKAEVLQLQNSSQESVHTSTQ